jgi:hypothetical protein
MLMVVNNAIQVDCKQERGEDGALSYTEVNFKRVIEKTLNHLTQDQQLLNQYSRVSKKVTVYVSSSI